MPPPMLLSLNSELLNFGSILFLTKLDLISSSATAGVWYESVMPTLFHRLCIYTVLYHGYIMISQITWTSIWIIWENNLWPQIINYQLFNMGFFYNVARLLSNHKGSRKDISYGIFYISIYLCIRNESILFVILENIWIELVLKM